MRNGATISLKLPAHAAEPRLARSLRAPRAIAPNCSAKLRPPVSGSVRGPVGVRNVAVIRHP